MRAGAERSRRPGRCGPGRRIRHGCLAECAGSPGSPVHSAVNVVWKDRTRHLLHYECPSQRVEAATTLRLGKTLPVWEVPAGLQRSDFPNRQQNPKLAAEIGLPLPNP